MVIRYDSVGFIFEPEPEPPRVQYDPATIEWLQRTMPYAVTPALEESFQQVQQRAANLTALQQSFEEQERIRIDRIYDTNEAYQAELQARLANFEARMETYGPTGVFADIAADAQAIAESTEEQSIRIATLEDAIKDFQDALAAKGEFGGLGGILQAFAGGFGGVLGGILPLIIIGGIIYFVMKK